MRMNKLILLSLFSLELEFHVHNQKVLSHVIFAATIRLFRQLSHLLDWIGWTWYLQQRKI